MLTQASITRRTGDAFLIRISTLALRCATRFLLIQDAEDVSQEVVLECLVKLRDDRQQLVRSGLKAYVRTMVFRRIIDDHRAAVARREREDQYAREAAHAHESTSPDVREELAEMEEIVRRAIESLTPWCRRVYSMVRDDERSYQSVASELGISCAAVQSQVVNAQRALRSALAADTTVRVPPLAYNTSTASKPNPDASNQHPNEAA